MFENTSNKITLVKMPPATRAKMDTVEAPMPKPVRAATLSMALSLKAINRAARAGNK